MGSENYYARVFNWRNYEYSKNLFAFSNDETGFVAFKDWMDDIAEGHGETWDESCDSGNGTNRPLLAESWSVFAGKENEGRSFFPYIPTGFMQRLESCPTFVFRYRKRLQ